MGPFHYEAMFKVIDTHILLTRGDTFTALIEIEKNGRIYTPTSQDSIRFALKKAYSDPEPILNIPIPYDTMVLMILPEQTKSLEFGEYKYDIEITFADGTVNTFIYESDFSIRPEVH